MDTTVNVASPNNQNIPAEMVLSDQEKEHKKGILSGLNDLQNKMMQIKSKVIQQIDEILQISQLWITDIESKLDVINFPEYPQYIQQQLYQDQLEKLYESHQEKIHRIIQNLITGNDFLSCSNILMNILTKSEQYIENNQIIQNQNITILDTEEQLNVKQVQLINIVKQQEISHAIAFNNSGSIMVAGFAKDIKVWSFSQAIMNEQNILNGHTEVVTCLVFSKKHNWFFSGSADSTIRCWKEDDMKDWITRQPDVKHVGIVTCLILDQQEDQLISCSKDKTIKVWKINFKENQLEYYYTLQTKHRKSIYSISLNDSETALVSCGGDKQIILWSQEHNNRWEFKHELQMDEVGLRICFISDDKIIWQQKNIGIVHLLEYNSGQLVKNTDSTLTLNKENGDNGFFQTIRNKKKQVIIQKHNRFAYILKQQANGQLSIVSEPIDCIDQNNFGNLTEDGQYLTIWNYHTRQFLIYEIIYD